MSSRVLVPIDGSPQAWTAFDHALATFEGAEVIALHVVDPASAIYSGMDGGYYSQEVFEAERERGERLCEQAVERAEEADGLGGSVLETAVETGPPARTILKYVDEHDVDHVVVGSHGRSGVARVLLGSVAETVARRSPVPVTIVR